MTSDTKTGFARAILCLILIAVIVCIGIVVFYAAVFPQAFLKGSG